MLDVGGNPQQNSFRLSNPAKATPDFIPLPSIVSPLAATLQPRNKFSPLLNGNRVLQNELMNGGQKHYDPRNYDDLVRITENIQRIADLKEKPSIGIICGSGLGGMAEVLDKPTIIPYSQIPGFLRTHVVGHKGNLVFGWLDSTYVMCLQGRFHPYEHEMNLALCAMPVRIMHLLGCTTLIVSNAAGGVNAGFRAGDLMLIRDHIFMPGLGGSSPLCGFHDPRLGQRFVSLHDAYDPELREVAKNIAATENISLKEGVYVMSGGPQYESPAEVNMYRIMGGDALGMSTCHEVVVARQCKMRVLGFSLITNICNFNVDTALAVSHEEVLEMSAVGGQNATKFVLAMIRHLEKEK